MKKAKILTFVLAAIAITALVVLSQLATDALDIMLATGVIMGVPTTQEVADSTISRFNKENISRKVVEMLPARTPLDTILRNIREAERIDSLIKTFYAVSSKPLKDVMGESAIGSDRTGQSAATAVISYTYAGGDADGFEAMYMVPANPTLWAEDDTFLMRKVEVLATGVVGEIAGQTTKFMDIMFYVISTTSQCMLVKPVNGILGTGSKATKYVMPDFGDDVVIYRMGNAKNELAAQTKPFAMLPEPDSNYCQYFMAQVEEGIFQRMHATEADWNFTDFEAQNIFAMRAEMEMSYLYGVKAIVVNPEQNNKRYTTNGITRSITNSLLYGTSTPGNRDISTAQYLNWMKQVFVGNNGSQERALFAGSTLIASLHTLEEVSKQLEAKNTMVKWGVEFNKIVTNFGSLLIYHHPLLSLQGAEDEGIILDLEHIRKHEFQPMEVTELELKTSGQRNADARVISEASCVTTSFPDCHAVIGPTA